MYRIKKLFQLAWFSKRKGKTGENYSNALERYRETTNNRNCFNVQDLPLRDMTLVVLDTETTGFKPHLGDEIISVGACFIEDGNILSDTFHELVNPGHDIPPFITDLTGISNEMVAGAEHFCSVAEGLLDILQNRIIVGHSIEFDLNFLNYKLKPFGIRIKNPYIDTCELSHAINKEHRIHTLDSILSRMSIPPEGRHTALGDALLTARVFMNFQKHLEDKEIFTMRDLRCFLLNAAMPKI